jgi:hypothetical protein
MPTSPSTDAPVRWKLYSAIPNDDTLGILIWNGGAGTTYTLKTATLVIQEYDGYTGTDEQATTSKPKSGGYAKTVVIDYSGVTFEEPPVKVVVANSGTVAAADINAKFANASTVVLTAESAASVTLTGEVTVPAGKTLKIEGNVTVTDSGTITGEGTLIGLPNASGATATAPGLTAYSLDSTSNYNPAGLAVVSASKNLGTGAVTVALGGTVSGGITDWQTTNVWGQKGTDAPTSGNWSGAVIKGILTTDALAANTVIKQTSQSLRYYTGYTDILAQEPDEDSPPTTNTSTIYINGDGSVAYKLRKYTSANGAQDGSSGSFGVLLWSGASPKTATLEITPSGGTKYTVIVDWSGLAINS